MSLDWYQWLAIYGVIGIVASRIVYVLYCYIEGIEVDGDDWQLPDTITVVLFSLVYPLGIVLLSIFVLKIGRR